MNDHQAGALRQEAVEDGLPPLPEPIRRQGQQMSYDDCDTVHFDCYTADQMQAYAHQAVATLRAERDAARADAERVWQPIETAPQTGRKVILFYLNRNNKPRTVMARWLTDEQAAETDADDVGLEGGWYESIDNWDDYCDVAIHEGEPSHWMPLPQPPDAAITATKETTK